MLRAPITYTKTATFFCETWGELAEAVAKLSGQFGPGAKLTFTQMLREADTADSIMPRVQCITIEEEIKE